MSAPPTSPYAAPAARPTSVLVAEHRVIERVLGALDRMAARARDEGALDVADAHDVVHFLREFADRCHHGKEEARLFPAMESRGLPHDAGPTAVMRAEHEEGRAYVRAMAASITGPAPHVAGFARAGAGFVHLLRDHIAKEDQVLFPMADGMLDDAEQARLLRAFADADESDFGHDVHVRFHAVAERLGTKYGVPAVNPLGTVTLRCHG